MEKRPSRSDRPFPASVGLGAGLRLFSRCGPEGASFLAALLLYLSTLSPGVLAADSGEFQFIPYVLGVAHPPGYPLYTMLGKLFVTLVPLGGVAYRMNLLSAVFAALALAVCYRLVRELSGGASAGLVAALTLAAVPTFWAQATTANIRSLVALFTALIMLFAGGKGRPSWRALAFTLGLAAGHHGSLLFLGLPLTLYLLVRSRDCPPKGTDLVQAGVAFLLSLAVLLYLPIRSLRQAPLAPTDLHTPGGFLNHVLARGFQGDMFYFARPSLLPERLRLLGEILSLEFGRGLLFLVGLGVLSLWRKDRALLLLAGGIILVNGFLAITYRAPQTVEYLMPSYVVLSFLAGFGAAWLGKMLGRWRAISTLAMALLVLLPARRLWRNYPDFRWLGEDRSVEQYAEELFEAAPPGATILANWHYVTPLWYLQFGEGRRPDVRVEYVYPEGAEPMASTWQRRINERVGKGSLVVTNRFHESSETSYRLSPIASAFLVREGPLWEIPQGLNRAQALFGDTIEVLGYELEGQELEPGRSLRVKLWWRPIAEMKRDYSFFLHIVGPEGQVWGQKDLTHPAGRYPKGEILVDEYALPLLPTVPPGGYRLIAGVYITLPEGKWERLKTPEGADFITLTQVEVDPSPRPPQTLHPLRQPFAGGLALIGLDYDRSLPSSQRLYLHWRVPSGLAAHQAVLYAEGREIARGEIPASQRDGYLTTAHDLPPGASSLELELRRGESEVAPLGVAGRPRPGRVRLAAAKEGARFIVLGGEMALVGASYRLEGRTLAVALDFLALKPILQDYAVSVQLEGPGWRAQHDGTPASGAIPTLKWLGGMRIRDEHHILLPLEARGGPAVLRLAVYDSFTQEPLYVLDERFLRLGQGEAIELARLP